MIRSLVKSSIFIIVLIIVLIIYLSFYGITTEKFNNHIRSEFSNINKNVKIDLFIASNSTTAIYYAIFNRIPYITYIDNNSINLSPLYPKKISYFYDDYSFSQSIKNFNFDKNYQKRYYLHSDTNLNKWKIFLNKFRN